MYRDAQSAAGEESSCSRIMKGMVEEECCRHEGRRAGNWYKRPVAYPVATPRVRQKSGAEERGMEPALALGARRVGAPSFLCLYARNDGMDKGKNEGVTYGFRYAKIGMLQNHTRC